LRELIENLLRDLRQKLGARPPQVGGSQMSPVFLKGAEELLQRLEPLRMPEARSLAEEARECAEAFRGWLSTRPADDDRVAVINRFLDLHRRAMEFLATHAPPSAG
jgi:hypothetical protein